MAQFKIRLEISGKNIDRFSKFIIEKIGSDVVKLKGKKYEIQLYKLNEELFADKIKEIFRYVPFYGSVCKTIPMSDDAIKEALKPKKAKNPVIASHPAIPSRLKNLSVDGDFFTKIKLSSKELDQILTYLEGLIVSGKISFNKNIDEPNPNTNNPTDTEYDEVVFGEEVKIVCQLTCVKKYNGYIYAFHRMHIRQNDGTWKDVPRNWLLLGPKKALKNIHGKAAEKLGQHPNMFVLV